MQSCGSPKRVADGRWIATDDTYNSFINGKLELFVYQSQWTIFKGYTIIAYSNSFGLHPLSIKSNEWTFIGVCSHEFRFFMTPNTCETAYTMDELGFDYFMRRSSSTIIWWIDPNTDEVQHSGAKYKNGKVGKRYCNICNRAYSANNFKSQHFRNLHTFTGTDIENTSDLYCVLLQYDV